MDARVVNAALVARMKTSCRPRPFPKDGGLRSASPIGAIDFVVDTGDIANREEAAPAAAPGGRGVVEPVPEPTTSQTLRLKNADGDIAPVFVVPGNHDASNAVGFIGR